jgi:negative regulator of flagellin synthesis FlgM
MRINDYRAAQIAQTYGPQGTPDASGKAKKAGSRTDGASLSSAAQELLKARRAVQDAPDVRSDLVAELRRQIQAGTYRVDDRAIARRLLPSLDLDA